MQNLCRFWEEEPRFYCEHPELADDPDAIRVVIAAKSPVLTQTAFRAIIKKAIAEWRQDAQASWADFLTKGELRIQELRDDEGTYWIVLVLDYNDKPVVYLAENRWVTQ